MIIFVSPDLFTTSAVNFSEDSMSIINYSHGYDAKISKLCKAKCQNRANSQGMITS
jgi:hypothetical protein